MTTTAIWGVKDGLDSVIRYVAKSSKTWRGQYDRAAKYHALENVLQYTADQMKTEKQFYVSGLNCDEQPDAAQKQFEITKRRFKKEGGIVCFHGYQSFAPGEVTPDEAHAIGIELAKRLWGDRFEVLVTTHLNTKAVHNHFCLNSVSFADGLRYYDQKATYKKMREVSDALCREWGLSVIEPKGRGRHIGEIKDEENGKPTVRGQIKRDIDDAIALNALPNNNINRMRMSKGAAYAVKAWAHLCMQDYANAATAAQNALNVNGNILNYKTSTTIMQGVVMGGQHPCIFRAPLECEEDYFFTYDRELMYALTPETVAYFEPGHVCKDKIANYNMMFDNIMDYGGMVFGLPGYLVSMDQVSGWNQCGLKTTHMYLILAECAIANNKIDDAMDILDQIRENRIDDAV